MIQSNHIKVFAFLSFLCSFFVNAYGYDNKDPICLEADNVNYDHNKGIISYQGKVHATQGTTNLWADEMLVYYNGKHKVEKVIAIGKLAQYKTLLNNDKDVLQASAKTIHYYPIVGKVILKNEALVEYNSNQFSGPYIFYDIKNKIISSHPKKNSQTKIILEPYKQLKTNF